jgi:hypothetical protein
MGHLDREIRRLGQEIRALEEMLVEAYGLAPVTPAIVAERGSAWTRRWRALYQRVYQSLPLVAESGDIFPVRAPQPD